MTLSSLPLRAAYPKIVRIRNFWKTYYLSFMSFRSAPEELSRRSLRIYAVQTCAVIILISAILTSAISMFVSNVHSRLLETLRDGEIELSRIQSLEKDVKVEQFIRDYVEFYRIQERQISTDIEDSRTSSNTIKFVLPLALPIIIRFEAYIFALIVARGERRTFRTEIARAFQFVFLSYSSTVAILTSIHITLEAFYDPITSAFGLNHMSGLTCWIGLDNEKVISIIKNVTESLSSQSKSYWTLYNIDHKFIDYLLAATVITMIWALLRVV